MDKDRGIIFLAIENANFLLLAFNAAVSIRVNNSNLPITIVCDEESNVLEEIERIENFFGVVDNIEVVSPDEYTFNGRKQMGILKSSLYEYTPYDETIFIDADSQISPNIDIETAFNFFDERDFWIDVNQVYERSELENSQKDFSWVKYSEIKKIQNYKFNQYPQLGSFFHGFKKSDKMDSFYEKIQKAQKKFLSGEFWWNDYWYFSIPDEAIFINSLVRDKEIFVKNNEATNYFTLGDNLCNRDLDHIDDNFFGITYAGSLRGKDVLIYEDRNERNFDRVGLDYCTSPNYKFKKRD